ncbi:MAG: right-handed parallel beta-helix repeat-containing protein, partial [Anaerolineae bacterium]|nr:right-handed parallel beta-helix repeat-containing protein [Anaerolineae bacterium]
MDAKYLKIISLGSRVLLLAVLLASILPSGGLAAPGDTILSGTQVSRRLGNQVFSNDGRYVRFETEPINLISLATFRQMDLYPNIETIGVVVNGDNLPKSAELLYRQDNESAWRTGHPLKSIDDGRLVGSLFELSPATSYSIRVVDGTTEIIGSVTTQPEELQFTPAVILHVDDDAAPGGDGSQATPYQSIQDGVNHATPGTQVLVADGLYHEEITFPSSGSAGNWIQVKAEGNGAILDGSKTLSGDIWRSYDKAKVWFMRVEGHFEYLARDQQRFFRYDDLRSLLEGRGDNNEAISEGWYLERSTLKLYVRSQSNPSDHTWQVPRLNHAYDINGQDWIWIEGFEMQFYGTQLDGCGVCATNASHVVIRNNKIHNMQLGIFINWTGGEERVNDTRIEYNKIYDPPVNEWPWYSVKGSSMEGTAIVLRGHIGAIVRENELHNFFNGIYTGSSAALENPELAFDIDVYENFIHHISDDALEPEGACINQRFRNNTFDSTFVGVSLAPITMGPTWIMRSTFANYTGRGIKWADYSDGVVLIYHNTFWTTAQDIAAMDFISPAHNAILRNNIFQNNGYAIYEVRTGSTGHDWGNNNWYSALSPHFKWENVDYSSIMELCMATGLTCTGHEEHPGLANPYSGNFTLAPSSPNIDRGAEIPGINDSFSGFAPDIGAYESMYTVDLPPTVISILSTDQNPTDTTSVNFTITFSEPVTGVNISPPFNDFALTTDPGIIGSTIKSITPVSEATYAVNVETGSGTGSIRLDLVDDNSILNAAGTPLGGANISDGNFNTGEAYIIERITPKVTDILRADSNPTLAESVSFLVTFSEAVVGLEMGDFFLETTGSINGAVITNISGSGSKYTVSVFTGGGEGQLRIDLQDNDSIMNASGTPLGGPGVGNGNFTSGEAYIVDKSIPIVTGILRADANPTAADVVDFTVVFTESVSGVDLNDFPLSISGNLSGAYITGISGTDNLFTISVNTGSGDGTLRLNILDNDSILDNAGSPLGGIGAGNGNFNIGEIYTIDKTAPVVTGILRSAPNPTTADNVTFRVGFMEAVYGVDVSDFTLTT